MQTFRDGKSVLLALALVVSLTGAVALGAAWDPFGDGGSSPPAELGVPPPAASPSPTPTPEPAVTEVPVPAVTEIPVPVVTEVPVPVVTEVLVPVEGPGCELVVSPTTLEVLDNLEEARQGHQVWVDYLGSYPDIDPADDGMTRNERLASEELWVSRYDQAIQLLQEAYVACSPAMTGGGGP